MKPVHRLFRSWMPVLLILALIFTSLAAPAAAQSDDPTPPAQTVKLIFIHHSTGENWLTDGYGDLGMRLGENNYFVSDTNYGWGPEGIGDRTDIVNWPEWFNSENAPIYMEALFTESGQHSGYTRDLPDPGGENQIVMFKSCFPNSMLEGNPDDPPAPGDALSVGNAKHIYNQLLEYFITRPDKLFIVITAPPVQDSTYAENARAFNQWLVQDWLAENDYPLSNVAVFDFYNLLTHPDNHHRYNQGQIEHVIASDRDTLYYDSDGDDHPNVAGSQKATQEFIPLLNIFYHRWVSEAPSQPPLEIVAETPTPEQPAEEPGSAEEPAAASQQAAGGELIDDFEAGAPADTQGWLAYWDEGTATSITCAPEAGIAYAGVSALHINFDIAANSWGTCALFYDHNVPWQSARGITFRLHSSQAALVMDVHTHGGTPDATTSYVFTLETTPDMADGWGVVELAWDQFLGVDWEANAGQPFEPSNVNGLSFGFTTFPDTPNTGEIWVDDLRLLGSAGQEAAPVAQVEPTAKDQSVPVNAPEQATEPAAESTRICGSSVTLLGIGMVLAAWSYTRRKGTKSP